MSTPENNGSNKVRWILVAGIVVATFLGAYGFASASSRNAATGTGTVAAGGSVAPASTGSAAVASGNTGAGSGASGGSGCACCGSSQPTANGVTGTETPGSATVEAGVQKVTVDVSNGTYNPNVITLKAGVPAEITFQNGTGCTQQVQSADLGFSADMGSGPATVKLDSLKPGTYSFYCGMQMVFGKIVVE